MVMAQLVRKRKKDTRSCPIAHLYFTWNRVVKIVFPKSDSVQSSLSFEILYDIALDTLLDL